MLEIVVRKDGHLRVADIGANGQLMRVRDYDSWPALFAVWGPSWTIATFRPVTVKPERETVHG